MSSSDDQDRERIRDRFLEIALEEVVKDAPVQELAARDVRRVPRWAILAAAGLLVLAVVVLWETDDELTPLMGGRVTGVVLTRTGDPVPGAEVRIEIGYVEHAFSDLRHWASAARRSAETDGDGRFLLESIPEAAVGMVFVEHEGAFARVPAEIEMEIVLAPAGSLEGRLVATGDLMSQLEVEFRGHGRRRGPWPTARPDPDGCFELHGLPPGPGLLVVRRGTWTQRSVPVVEVDGEKRLEGPVRVEDGIVVGPDPLAAATWGLLLDESGAPMSDTMLGFALWNHGSRIASNSEGGLTFFGSPIKPAGSRVLLRLACISKGPWSYSGELLAVEDRTAVIGLTRMRHMRGEVRQIGGESIREYALLYVTDRAPPRLYTGHVLDGRFTTWIPTGRGTAFVLTPGGHIHRVEMDITPSDEPLDRLFEVLSR
jgi:hypothetical protein